MKALVIEDEKGIIDAIDIAFEFCWADAKLIASTTGKKVVSLVKTESPDIVILDLNLPDIIGFHVR